MFKYVVANPDFIGVVTARRPVAIAMERRRLEPDIVLDNSPPRRIPPMNRGLLPDIVSDTCGVVTARLVPDVVSDNSDVVSGCLLPDVVSEIFMDIQRAVSPP